MDINDLGYNTLFEQFRNDNELGDFTVGRVVAEHKERYTVRTANNELDAEITGNLRFAATSREDFPAVGDWVALTVYEPDFGVIYKVFPRFSILSRQSVGHSGEVQIIATNVDYAFLVQAVDRDFNINRLERYLTICHSAGVKPIVVLTKTDLIDAEMLLQIKESVKQRIKNIPLLTVSNTTQKGLDSIRQLMEKGKTYCMLGSSGVGKSSLINNLRGESVMQTDAISTSTGKGRHVTTHRELVVLENGGILIDNPGMREVGITDVSEGLSATFDSIFEYAKACKYQDCTHTTEVGCAVIDAVQNGLIDQRSYNNYLKMNKEKDFFESSIAERRKRDKNFDKMLKDYKNGKSNY
jgi:ribosome biogenesis GTPase / thiamine phosphate phosphatase